MRLDTYTRINKGDLTGCFARIERDRTQDGYFVIVRASPHPQGAIQCSDWMPTLDALNTFLRDRDWLLHWN